MDDEELLAEQRAFYRARAPRYDDWWLRRGRYERGEEAEAEWHRQEAIVEAALEAFGAEGDVLELAGGTGWWTKRLAQTAAWLTVVDASPETLALNRQRVGRDDVGYVVSDIFSWQPTKSYDVVFFSFWLSHVPRPRFGAFWRLVRRCLAPGGRAFFIDNRTVATPGMEHDPYVIEYAPDLHLRRLDDGSQFRVVKVMYEPEELQSLLATEGWDADVSATPWFIFGSARPAVAT